MAACRLIVCEKSGNWASALRDALGKGQPRVVETRSLAACEAELAQSPASLMAIEVIEANLEAILQFLMKIHEGYHRATVVALVASEASAAANLLREAGAVEVITSVLDVPRVARMARRQFALAPKQEVDVQDFVAELMPWAATPGADAPGSPRISSPRNVQD
jgi:hypothetical protein